MNRILVTAAVTALTVLGGSPAMAAPPTDGCARGYELWDVATEPYKNDTAADTNGDGFVCARALGEGHSKQYGTNGTIYGFTDNDLAVRA